MNKYSFDLAWSDEDEGFIATSQEFPGLSAFGATAREALSEAEIALELMIESYEEDRVPLPQPRVRYEHSGQFRVRLPKTLHRALVEMSRLEGVSLNQFVATTLAERAGFSRGRKHEQRASRFAYSFLRVIESLRIADSEQVAGTNYPRWLEGVERVLIVPTESKTAATTAVEERRYVN
jgi:predicted RNase H-like HicB family nuclease